MRHSANRCQPPVKYLAVCLGLAAAPRTQSGSNMPFFCYILQCADGTFYTGWTTDPPRREKVHNAGRGARYTRARRPVRIIYVEPQTDRSTAMRRELQIKRLSHAKKQALADLNLPL
jgi:putative endonuclease